MPSIIPDSTSIFNSAMQKADLVSEQSKFWLIDDLWHFLHKLGLSTPFADLLAFVVACAILAVMVWLIDAIITKLSLSAIKRHSKKTKTTLDDVLVQTKFFSRLFQLLPLIAVHLLSPIIFAGFKPGAILLVQLITQSVVVVVSLLISFSLLNTWQHFYMLRPAAGRKSVKGYIQVAKIVLSFIAGILIISILAQKDPSNLFVGLGATAALFSLVFKDTILGFVASIQLSAQDMVRPGDWIEMPAKNADGTVLDINVNSVKVQNWDNTITMIPIYSMVSESFTNWRGMEQSDGRRLVRYIYVNIESVHFATPEMVEKLKENPITAQNYQQLLTLCSKSSPAQTMSNLALYRAHLELFLREHPKINEDMPLYVRYKQEITDKGIGIEIYAFSRDKEAQNYDAVHRSVVEYVVAVAPLFDITLFQSPSGEDFKRI